MIFELIINQWIDLYDEEEKGGEQMAAHGPFKNKGNARDYAEKMRDKGFNASLYKKKSGWCVSVTKK